jgi:hypothetical protein
VRITAKELELISAGVAQALCGGSDAPVKGSPAAVAAAIAGVLQENFRAEAAIDQEVEKQLSALGSAARGMDTEKLKAGLRERIAKQRKFVL